MFVYLHYSFYANYLFINKNVRCCRYFELFSLQFTIEIRNNKSVTDNFVFYLSCCSQKCRQIFGLTKLFLILIIQL